MADGFSTLLKNELLDHVFGCGTRDYTAPTRIDVALSRADPLADGSGIDEPAGGDGYARIQTDQTKWTVAAAGHVENSALISFPTPTGDWGLCTHAAAYDQAGNFLARGPLAASKTINTGDTVQFPAGDIGFDLSDT